MGFSDAAVRTGCAEAIEAGEAAAPAATDDDEDDDNCDGDGDGDDDGGEDASASLSVELLDTFVDSCPAGGAECTTSTATLLSRDATNRP